MDGITSTCSSPSRRRLAGAMEVQDILHPGGLKDADVPMDQQSSTVTSPTSTVSRSGSLSFQQHHRRSSSIADSSRNRKRLSMTIPIQTGGIYTSTRTTPSPTKSAAPPTIPEGLASPTGPTDANFLTALATQERRVLELKEELLKAEQVLRKLKHDWATHEAQKKRHDAKRVQKLRPLSGSLPSTNVQESENNGAAIQQAQDLEKRKTLISGTRISNRTVFSGSRHARTLSLLSPDNQAARHDHLTDFGPQSATLEKPAQRPPYTSRASTNADLTREAVEHIDEDIELGLPREVLLNTGRKMASDFKDGLWTFLEDLRQATVGEEGVNGTQGRTPQRLDIAAGQRGPRKMPSKAGMKATARPHAANRQSTNVKTTRESSHSPVGRENQSDLIDVGGSFWKENGIDGPRKAESPTVRKATRKSPRKSDVESIDGTESWDNWDSPTGEAKQARSNNSGSVFEPQRTASIASTTSRTSVSSSRDNLQPQAALERGKGDSIPWPAISQLTPGNLRRTASHLMHEWEKSLTSPEEPQHTQADYLGTITYPVRDLKAD